MYGVAVYPLDLARAEAVELHRRSAGSGLAVDVADLTGCSGRRRFVLARQLVEGFPVGGDHVGDFEEGATDLLLLGMKVAWSRRPDLFCAATSPSLLSPERTPQALVQTPRVALRCRAEPADGRQILECLRALGEPLAEELDFGVLAVQVHR